MNISPKMKFRIIFDPKFIADVVANKSDGYVRLKGDAGLPVDYGRVYVLRAKGGTLFVPNALTVSPDAPIQALYTIVSIEDPSGKVYSRGDYPPKGQIRMRVKVYFVKPTFGHPSGWYFQFAK